MATRKRKSPDKKKPPVRQPSLLTTFLVAAGRAAARHPKPLFGVAAFGIVFSFVAANALWYQPGGHPSPFLATRDPEDPVAIAGRRPPRRAAPEEVTTFRIERAEPLTTEQLPSGQSPAIAEPGSAPTDVPAVAAPIPRPDVPATGTQWQPAEAAPAHKPAPVELARVPTPPPAGARPQPMPPKSSEAVRPSAGRGGQGEDPVAAAIRAAERNPAMRPPADIPNTGSTPVSASGRPSAVPAAHRPPKASSPSTDLVLQIQRGLSNIAYADVEVDGVAGAQTRAAIRRFEKHYRLPETGEPNEMVLKKLKSIGAL